MKNPISCLILIFVFVGISAQQDSIHISAKISEDGRQISVIQKIKYYNHLSAPISKIKLLNWISAYKKRNTELAKRRLENRKNDLYFATENQLGKLKNIDLQVNGLATENPKTDKENIFVPLEQPLQAGNSVEIDLHYALQLPDKKFTGYGSSENEIALKYFFLVPDSFEDEKQSEKFYHDVEETQNAGSFWDVYLESSNNAHLRSNLKEIGKGHFQGRLSTDPEFLISQNEYLEMRLHILNDEVLLQFGYPLNDAEKLNIQASAIQHLQFLKRYLGFLPEKIFISNKFKDKEDFFGNNDIKFWKFKFQLFSDFEKTDLDYFSIISKNVMENIAITDKTNQHWWKNGLKTYLEIQYLKQFYKDEKLLGKLPENLSLFGIRPLKMLYASKLSLTDRYGIAYQYIMSQNLDQKIGERFTDFSNFNEMAISNFETGVLFNFISEKIGSENFDQFLKKYLQAHQYQRIDTKDFLGQLSTISNHSSDFLESYFLHKQRVNFNLKHFKKLSLQYDADISKNSNLAVPFQLETEKNNGGKSNFWFDTDAKKGEKHYVIPNENADKIIVNDGFIFPEKTFRDNYLYTKGFFANAKKIRFKFLRDIPNPEFNEIYVTPKFSFNAYDKLLLGINFKNKSFINQNFLYSITPYYSTGTGKITGSAGASYSFMPAESFYRSLQLGVSGSYFHYDYDLAYQKYSASISMNFTKNPRSTINRSLGFSYNYFEKDLTPQMILNREYQKYNLWNIGYGYSDSKMIHEKSLGANFQWMEDFQKLSAETYYRWEYAQNKKISFRFYGGIFLKNKTRNNLFDFGISRLSNYSFSYGLLGQSAASGVLSQQYILAEGGFKSYVGNMANQWITSVNVDSHLWKMFNIYADAGLYKNSFYHPKFIWDSGIKVKVIPDFLEVYFPVQSSLGFEPSFKDYGYRIRYTLIFNFSSFANYFRRGWF